MRPLTSLLFVLLVGCPQSEPEAPWPVREPEPEDTGEEIVIEDTASDETGVLHTGGTGLDDTSETDVVIVDTSSDTDMATGQPDTGDTSTKLDTGLLDTDLAHTDPSDTDSVESDLSDTDGAKALWVPGPRPLRTPEGLVGVSFLTD